MMNTYKVVTKEPNFHQIKKLTSRSYNFLFYRVEEETIRRVRISPAALGQSRHIKKFLTS